jgi:hypothetical protein
VFQGPNGGLYYVNQAGKKKYLKDSTKGYEAN